jgi:hypothetical protein
MLKKLVHTTVEAFLKVGERLMMVPGLPCEGHVWFVLWFVYHSGLIYWLLTFGEMSCEYDFYLTNC